VITTWCRGIADENMNEAILVDLRQRIRRHPWWHARARITLALLDRLGVEPPARILDAGCGWGITLEALERRGYRCTGLDISRRILEELDRPDRELIEADLTLGILGDTQPFDAVLALDVIEHVDDDRATVKTLGRLVRPGGFLTLSVPALPEFFTEFDRIQGHRRRYTPETLRAAFDESGLAVQQIFWWGEWLVPLLRRQRGRPKSRPDESVAETYRRYLKLPPWPGPLMLRLAFAWEQARALDHKLNIGTSLFAIARRTKAPGTSASSEA
jgi:2-polyprenyl-3-methyl-5-hydroxy-6-metoxy-1,4-benzoquinol methylase